MTLSKALIYSSEFYASIVGQLSLLLNQVFIFWYSTLFYDFPAATDGQTDPLKNTSWKPSDIWTFMTFLLSIIESMIGKVLTSTKHIGFDFLYLTKGTKLNFEKNHFMINFCTFENVCFKNAKILNYIAQQKINENPLLKSNVWNDINRKSKPIS